MSEMAEAEPLKSVPEEVPSVTVETSDTNPEMMVISRRRKRRSNRSKAKVDPVYRRIHATLVVLVIFLLAVSVTGNFFRDTFAALAKRAAGTLHGMHQIRLEVVFLIVALLILVYLTPGVEQFIFRKLGIKHRDD